MRVRPGIIPATLASVLALALAACSSGGASESSDTSAKKTTTTKPAATVLLTQGDSAVASAGSDVALDDATRQAVLDASQRYVDAAVLEPLVKGAVGTAYTGLFDASVSASAAGPDRAALTDEGITTVTTSPTVTASPVRSTASPIPVARCSSWRPRSRSTSRVKPPLGRSRCNAARPSRSRPVREARG
jgi:hypothetical protein